MISDKESEMKVIESNASNEEEKKKKKTEAKHSVYNDLKHK